MNSRTAWRHRLLGALFAIGCLALAPAVDTARAAPGDAVGGDSEWNGRYFYPDNRPPVPFSLRLRVAPNGAVSGSTEEPATFGNGTSPKLYAGIVGVLQGSSLQFTKTYDGTGGVRHSVEYSGSVSADATSMSGTWRVRDFSGRFEAVLTRR
jgi:hypothetical protein